MAGDSKDDRFDVSDWENIVAVSAGDGHVVGLRADGTAVVTKCYHYWGVGRSAVAKWTDIKLP